jgi:hypothetical protein
MTREISILICPDGQIEVAGDDLPDDWPAILEAMVGTQPVNEELGQLINIHLCG